MYFDIYQILLCCLGLSAVGFVACAWLVLCLCCLVQQLSSWTVSSTSGICVLPYPSASLDFFCVACSAQVAFCLVWCLRLRLLVRGAFETLSLAEGVGKLCICSYTVCLVLCCVIYFDIYQILQCCLCLRRNWLRRLAWLVLCLCFLVQQLSSWTVSSTKGMCVLPSPSASLGSFFALPAQPKWLFP